MALRITGSVIGEPITSSSTSATGMWTSQEVAALQKDGIWQIAPTFTLTPSAATVNEGASITITLTTTGIPNGVAVPYVITGANVDSNDGNITSNFVIQNGSNTISFAAIADSTLEGPETFTITAGGASANVTINDTSTGLDAQFPYTTLLLHGDGTNNAQNNTFLDSSINNFTMTRNGNPTQGTFTPYGANWSNYFDGSGQAFYNSSFSGANFGASNNFTIEMWVLWQASTSANHTIFELTGTTRMIIGRSSTGIRCYNNGTERGYSVTVPVGTWNHIAIVRNSGTTTIYLNGVSGTSFADTTNWVHTQFYTSRNSDGAEVSSAFYMSNLRVVNGTAVYTTNFIPPTSPLTAISNTTLLLCQSNGFKDNSTNNFPLSILGTPSVQRFSPFSPTSAYNANTYGGAAYLDGTGDYLTVPQNAVFNFGTGDFTVEGWWNFSTITTSQGLVALGTGANAGGPYTGWWFDYESSGILRFYRYAGGSEIYSSFSVTLVTNTWYHIACTRSGTDVKMFVNGTQVGTTATSSTSFDNVNSDPLVIGRIITGQGTFYLNGYVSDVRVVKGTAIYTGNFTLPTAPVTTSGSSAPYASTANVNTTFAAANTSLLCNFTNAGIIDNTMMATFETIDSAKLSTSISKFGGSSMYFDGTNLDNIQARAITPLGAGNFTIEFWIYPLDTPDRHVFSLGTGWSSATGVAMIQYGGNYAISCGAYGTANIGQAVEINGWHHIAIVRNNTAVQFYYDGVLKGSGTDTNNLTDSRLSVGYAFFGTWTSFYGYMDDFRITKGYARYTTNFTPPTLAHGDK
jgi:hypothetical protein